MTSNSNPQYDYFFHSPQRHAQGLAPTVSDKEDNFYKLLSQRSPHGQLYVYYNSEISSRPSAFDYEHSAKGYALALSKRMPLSDLCVEAAPDDWRFLLSSRWFGRVSVLSIPPEAIPDGMRERDMRQIVQDLTPSLDGSAARFFEERQQLAASIMVSNNKKPRGARDASPWQAGISGHGHFAGLFKNKNTTLAGGQDAYYLAAHSDSDYLGEALNGYAVTHRDLTLGQFAVSPQMEGVRNYSERNAQTILAKLADALSLKRDLVPLLEDLQAYPPGNNLAPPELAHSLQADTVYNDMHDPIADGNTLVYYNTTTRINTSDKSQGRIAMLRNAKQGLALLTLDKTKDYTVFKHNIVSGRDQSHLIAHSNPHAAIPIGLGRVPGDAANALAVSKLDADDAVSMLKTFSWRNKPLDIDARSSEQVVKALNPRLYSYKNMDQATRTIVEFTLGSKTEQTNLKPVAVILPNSDQ